MPATPASTGKSSNLRESLPHELTVLREISSGRRTNQKHVCISNESGTRMSDDHQESQAVIRGVVDDDRLLKPTEAAALLGIERSKVHTLIKDGQIDTVRIGRRGTRITRGALRGYIARCTEAPLMAGKSGRWCSTGSPDLSGSCLVICGRDIVQSGTGTSEQFQTSLRAHLPQRGRAWSGRLSEPKHDQEHFAVSRAIKTAEA
jgi:excisionase family DNA binding protein